MANDDDRPQPPTPEEHERWLREQRDQTTNNVNTELADAAAIAERWARLSDEQLQSSWINDVHEAIAASDLTNVQVTWLLRRLRDRFGWTLNDMRRDLAAAARVEDDDERTHDDWARQWLNALRTEVIGERGLLWTLDAETNVWTAMSREAAITSIARMRGPNCRTHQQYVAIYKLALDIATASTSKNFDDAPHGVAIRDTFYYWDGEGLKSEALAPGHLCRLRLDTELVPLAEAPRFARYLDDTFPASDPDSESLRELFAQHLFVALFGLGASLQKALLWVGPTASGKTTAQKILRRLLPDDLVTSVPLHHWDDQYSLAQLATATVNLAGEVNYKKVISTEFLMVTGDEAALSARFPYGQPFTFRPRVTHIFNSNEFPKTNIHNAAFFRRWSPLLFAHTKPEAERVHKLEEKIEPGGVLAFALGAAASLIGTGGHLQLASGAKQIALMKAWEIDTDSIAAFLADDEYVQFTAELHDYIGRQAFYDAYREYCEDMGKHPVNQHEFRTALLRRKDELGIWQTRKGDMRVWAGVKVRDPSF